MKAKNLIILSLITVAVAIGCSNSDDKDPLDDVKSGLCSSEWHIHYVELDDEEYTDLYEGLTLQFNEDNTYTVINPVEPVWSEGGIYELRNTSTIILDGTREVTVEELSDETLILSFNYSSTEIILSSVGGRYTFEFTANTL